METFVRHSVCAYLGIAYVKRAALHEICQGTSSTAPATLHKNADNFKSRRTGTQFGSIHGGIESDA